MTTHVMLDLETYGVSPGCPVLSIGAVRFDGIAILGAFYGVAKLDQSGYGLTPEAETILFWEGQPAEARKVLEDPSAIPLPDMLADFAAWLDPDAYVWGNGAGFDQPILAAAYKAVGADTPWKFYNERCYRTMKALAPDVKLVRTGTHHNALDDATSQANHLIRIVNNLGITLE